MHSSLFIVATKQSSILGLFLFVTIATGDFARGKSAAAGTNKYCQSIGFEERPHEGQCSTDSTLSPDHLFEQCVCEPIRSSFREIRPFERGTMCEKVNFAQTAIAWIESTDTDAAMNIELTVTSDGETHPGANHVQRKFSPSQTGDMVVFMIQQAKNYVVSFYNNTIHPVRIHIIHVWQISASVYVTGYLIKWHFIDAIRHRERMWRRDMQRIRMPV